MAGRWLESGKDTNILKNASKMASGKAVSANFGGPYLETPAADRDVRGRFPAYLEVDKKLRYFFPRSLHAIICLLYTSDAADE